MNKWILALLVLVGCSAAARSAWEKRVRVASDTCHEYLDATAGDNSTPEGYVKVACQAFDLAEPEIILLLESDVWDHMKKKPHTSITVTIVDAGPQ